MCVKDIKDGVCSFYATLHTEYHYSSHSVKGVEDVNYYVLSVQWPLTPPGGKTIVTEFEKPSVLWV